MCTQAKIPILLLLLLLLPLFCLSAADSASANNEAIEARSISNPAAREALEVGIGIGIGIGGGGGAEAPSPSESPPAAGCGCAAPAPPPRGELQPSDFADMKLYLAYNVIQRFKKSITCDPNGVTASWNGADICNQYKGFYCSNPPDNQTAITIASVDFNGFGLCAPTTSGFLDQLPDLAIFHANSNNFTGTVPDISKLRYLYELDVSNNRMSGPYPTTTLALAQQLLFLDLRYNFFSGAVPASVFGLDVEVLFLNNNNFNQPLPATIGRSTAAYLTLANNGFTGAIPPTIKNTSDTLIEVLFLNNRLSGCLPYEIGFLGKATVFDVGYNLLTGPIPLSFGCLGNVEQLNLAGNLLYGHVPDVVCQLGNLANLSLSDNYFTSLGPSCWKLLKSGVLDVRKNCIPGLPMQRPPWQCAYFASKPKFCSYVPTLYHDVPCKSCSKNGRFDQRLPPPPWTANRKERAAPSPTYTALHRQNP
ncbi:hypothetical protein Taro_042968 [Colocasia esculenta]|uniref:Leucine-rich repeat-containing N-terminal plant-type domain-containing protein n=1 Tax=Colocasia esculenta TaxID=4460 RepID=A0A843X3F3_COLES|nr:hypothetical protein [Colocasia esculenta]